MTVLLKLTLLTSFSWNFRRLLVQPSSASLQSYHLQWIFKQRFAIKFYFKAGKKVLRECLKCWKLLMVSLYYLLLICFVGIASFYWVKSRLKMTDAADCTTKIDENIACVAVLLKKYQSASCQLLEKLSGIPKTIVQQITTSDLQKRKLCTHFVPHVLTAEPWWWRFSHLHNIFKMIQMEPNFVNTIIKPVLHLLLFAENNLTQIFVANIDEKRKF